MEIILDGKVVEKLAPESLPMLIHGKEGSGASLYTIALAAKWYRLGYKILFLCGYKMAEEEFTRIVGEHSNARFYTKERVDEFLSDLKEIDNQTIVVVKNVELFNLEVVDSVKHRLCIISGDLSNLPHIKRNFITEVYFSNLEGKKIPELQKYQGYVISGGYSGITRIEK